MPAIASTARRFEFVAGSSDKYWEIDTRGTEVTVRFGRNGTQGQTQTKSFASRAAATKHAENLIRAGVGKGYLEAA